jgi:hypothetical protein
VRAIGVDTTGVEAEIGVEVGVTAANVVAPPTVGAICDDNIGAETTGAGEDTGAPPSIGIVFSGAVGVVAGGTWGLGWAELDGAGTSSLVSLLASMDTVGVDVDGGRRFGLDTALGRIDIRRSVCTMRYRCFFACWTLL